MSGKLVSALIGPGSPYELIDEDVLGARMQCFRNRPRSVVELLESGAVRFPGRPYLVFPDRTLTFDGILSSVARVAEGLRVKYGVGRGDRVGIFSANRAEYSLTFWAAVALGAVAVAFNGWWTGPEVRDAIDLTGPKLVLGDTRRLHRLAPHVQAGDQVVNLETDFAALEDIGAGAPLPAVQIDEDDPFVILFTSGTTGKPKGAMISHRSNLHFGLVTQLQAATARAVAIQTGAGLPAPALPCSINASPMFHIAGLTCSMVLAPASGMTIVYPPPGRWTEQTHLELTQKYGASAWSLVPTQLWRLLDWPALDQYDLSSLATIGGGSAVWPPELLKRLGEQLPGVRPALGMGYGMTETNGLGTSLRGADTYAHPDSIGRAAPTVLVEVRDPETRAPVADGVTGEIALRSAATFLGYWRNPEATASALDADRWYHTGDFGHVQDGFVYLEGRRQDLIIRGGENIYPVEIENRLFEHADIAEAAVVGIEHATLGQQVKAYITVRPGAELDAAAVRAWCSTTLAAFKVPSEVEFLPDLPHNASGKVLKHLLVNSGIPAQFIAE